MDKQDLAVDQAMVVWAGVATRHRYDGVVKKIGRKYVTIEVWRGSKWTTDIEFDIETQRERGNTSHYAAIFRTPQQQELLDREEAVRDGLKSWGLSVSYGGPRTARKPTLEQMESILFLLDRWDSMLGEGDEDEALPGSPGGG